MECPKCGFKAICAEKKEQRNDQGDPVVEYRTYVCTNWDCLHGFVYRNRFLNETERLDTARFLRRYERQKEAQQTNQEQLQFQEDGD